MTTITKTWIINKKNLDEADLAWLRSCCNRIETKVLEKYDITRLGNNQSITVPGRAETTVETISDEQESMLQLKYSGHLLLKTVIHHDKDGQLRGTYWV